MRLNKYQVIYFVTLLIALMAAFLESMSYLGFVAIHFFFPAYIWYLLASIIALVSKPIQSPLQSLLKIISWISVSVYVSLMIAESLTYPNFVYTLTHINLQGLQIFVLLIWFILLVSQDKQTDPLLRLGKNLLFAALIFVSAEGLGLSLAFLTKGITYAVSHSLDSYEDKLTKAHGGFYSAMRLVTELTPSNTLILIPPQGNPWEVEGNAPMVTYYLYPRKVENLRDQIGRSDRQVYALIAHGSWPKSGDTDYGWPKIKLSATRLWKFDVSNHSYLTYHRDYDPATDNWDWGLIEVSHE